MKRKLTLTMAAVMASSSMAVTGYAANFTDIDNVPWEGAKEVINEVADLGLLNGYSDGTFGAKKNVTYSEALHMVYTALEKSGAALPLEATDHYKFIPVMESYNIPQWAQRSVAYGLQFNLITVEELAKFMPRTDALPATREDVATMFGIALAVRYDVEKVYNDAAKFKDSWKISEKALPLVDLMARLGIISGDDQGNYNPKNSINRAEMAVMLNKTYDILKTGVETKGEITSLTYDGRNFDFTVKYENGEEQRFYASSDHTKVYIGSGNEETSLSRLAVGDEISVNHNGDSLVSIRLLDGSTSQTKYDTTGYIESIKGSTLTLENENTGDEEELEIGSSAQVYIDGKKETLSTLQKKLKDNYDMYAYAGINVVVETEYTGESGNKAPIQKTKVVEVHVDFSDNYVKRGRVTDINSDRVKLTTQDNSGTSQIDFSSDTEFYIEGKESNIEDLEDMVEDGTSYIAVTVGKNGKAIKVDLTSESFTAPNKEEAKIYTLGGLTQKQIGLESGGKKYIYEFGSTNPLVNLDFYTWDKSDENWDEVSIENAEKFYEDADGSVYVRVNFNSGGKLSRIELSREKSAWTSDNSYNNNEERKGEVESLSGNTLKFKNSNTEYELLNAYNVKTDGKDSDDIIGNNPNGTGDVKNPLTIHGAKTSSLTVFKKMAESGDVVLSAEVVADGNGKVQKIDAQLIEAEGIMKSLDLDEDYLVLELETGEVLNLETASRVKTETDEYSAEDLQNTSYVDAKVAIEFNSDGEVETIEVLENDGYYGSKKIEGIATGADNGLKLEGSSDTYGWGKTSELRIENHSGTSESIYTIKDMIEDPSLEVYVEAVISDRDKVEKIEVYVRSAEGKFQNLDMDDDTVRILTEDNNKFTFKLESGVDIDFGSVHKDDVNENSVGDNVTISFDEESGLVSEVKN